MNYKMIVLDIDDTLINNELEITELTKNKLIELQKNGIIVTLCSGRPTPSMVRVGKELLIEEFGGYIISYNGANILNCSNNEIIYENNLSVEQIHRLYDLSVKNNVGIHTYNPEYIIATEAFKYTKFEADLIGMDLRIIDDFKSFVNKPVVKAIMVEEPQVLRSIEGDLKKYVDDLSMTFSKPFFLEFMNNSVDKGQSLKWLCENIGIDREDVIAFGDSHNDLPMLKFAGKSVAMGNAVNEVKDLADFITKTNNEDGIFHALEKFM